MRRGTESKEKRNWMVDIFFYMQFAERRQGKEKKKTVNYHQTKPNYHPHATYSGKGCWDESNDVVESQLTPLKAIIRAAWRRQSGWHASNLFSFLFYLYKSKNDPRTKH